jgi:hypothetical protein
MTVRPPWRWLTALLLLVNAGVHIPLVPEHLDEAPYIGVLFILLSVACIVLAAVIVVVDTTWVWAASGTISLLALVAFVLSRTVGLPQIGDDVGNWTDPLGFPALASEALTVALAAGALRRRAAATACA